MKIHARRPGNAHPMGMSVIISEPLLAIVLFCSAVANDGQIRLSLTDITNLGPDDGIALKWDVVQGALNVDYFRILYRTQHTNPADQGSDEYFILDESLSSDVRSYIVDSLKPAITYNFKVEAVSKLGHQYASNSKDFTLPSNGRLSKTASSQNGSRDRKSRSLSPPVILEIWEMPNKDTKLDVALKWKMRSNQQIEGFRIHYKVLSDSNDRTEAAEEVRVPVGQDRSSNPVTGQRIFTHLIKGLRYSREYEFRICAYNKHQSSDLSNVVSIFKSDDGAESVIHIQDASSVVSERLSMLESGIGDISTGLNEKRAPRLLEHTVRTNHYVTNPHQQHQTMLLYTSLAIAIVSLLLLLFTATLVFMLRHFRRRQRRFRSIHNPYGESLCSFESKHPCLATSSKKPYSSNCTECCCENISNSSVVNGGDGKMLPGLHHLFSLGRVSHRPAFNNSTATRFIAGPALNPAIVEPHCPSNQRCSDSYEQSTYNMMHHRCSCCRAIIDNLGRIGGCPVHHLAMRPPLVSSKNGNFAETTSDQGSRNNCSQHASVDNASAEQGSAGSQERGRSPADIPTRNEQENFYHTLTDTPVPRLVSPSPDRIPSPPCLRSNTCCKASSVCQCCGKLAGST